MDFLFRSANEYTYAPSILYQYIPASTIQKKSKTRIKYGSEPSKKCFWRESACAIGKYAPYLQLKYVYTIEVPHGRKN